MTDPVKPTEENVAGEVEEEYESDEYDVNEDDDGELQEGDEVEADADEAEDKGKSLTALLLAENGKAGAEAEEEEDDEDDEGYVPGGGVDPADEEVDGDKRELSPDAAEEVSDLVHPKIPGISAVDLKRKTSGDEGDEEEEENEEGDAKRVKV